MNRTLLLLLGLLISAFLSVAQTTNQTSNPPCENPKYVNDKEIFDIVEVMPSFPGGEDSLDKFLSENFKRPKDLDPSIKKIYVRVIIDEHGNVVNPCIIPAGRYTVTAEMQQSFEDMIEIMPKWNPGLQRRISVNVRYHFPIKFE